MSPEQLEHFKCMRCGACCRLKGIVRVREKECEEIAAFLRLTVSEFIDKYTRLAPDRRSLVLADKPDGACCFYDENQRLCRINEAKPRQCRDFPFGWNNPGWEEYCVGAKALDNEKR